MNDDNDGISSIRRQSILARILGPFGIGRSREEECTGCDIVVLSTLPDGQDPDRRMESIQIDEEVMDYDCKRRIMKLKRFREDGLISDEEYFSKVKAIKEGSMK